MAAVRRLTVLCLAALAVSAPASAAAGPPSLLEVGLPGSLRVPATLVLAAQATEPGAVAQVVAHVRLPGETGEQRLALSPDGRGRFEAAIAVERAGSLEAWLEAFDERGRLLGSAGSADSPLSVACLSTGTVAGAAPGMRLGLVALVLLGALLLRSHPAAPDATAHILGRRRQPVAEAQTGARAREARPGTADPLVTQARSRTGPSPGLDGVSSDPCAPWEAGAERPAAVAVPEDETVSV